VANECAEEREKMKKLNRSDGWEDSPLVSSKSFEAEFDELDEEIIELDDEIIELPGNGLEDEEEPAFDVEILDADRPLGLKENEIKMESEEEFLLEDDLLKDLPFFQDQPAEAEPAKSAAGGQGEPTLEEPDLELFSDTSLLPPEGLEAPEGPAPAGKAEAPGFAETSPAAVSQLMETPAESDTSLEDFMIQIEIRLLDTVRELVEARLPEIVRTVLREEIERLKTDQDSEQ
jgi:hypothetical protein